MHRTSFAIAAAGAAALAALCACSKKTETASTGTAANATATAPASSTPAAGPPGPPSRRAGLWEQAITTEKMTQTTKICLDEATDAKMKWWGSQVAGKNGCSEQKITPHLGGGWEFHAVCAMGESGTVTSDGQATGDFNSHYTVNVTSTTSGSPMPQANGAHKVTIDANWKGPCPTGMRAGDMELPGGMKINMVDAMSGAPAGPHAGNMSASDMSAMRKQAEAMAKQMKAQEKQ